MTNKITYNAYKKDGTKEEKTIEEIIIIDIESKKLLGTAYGNDIHHCISLAKRFCPNFDELVSCYSLGKLNPRQRARGINVAIEFYQDKK